MRDEGFAYTDRLEDAGIPVEHEHYEGMIHGFVNLVDMVDQSREALGVVANELRDSFK
ncbi:MAG TPA: alpha/beta hydrolase [Halococcus sp.]|nr:alpha/beta hydrolase [Halococcus sp.]